MARKITRLLAAGSALAFLAGCEASPTWFHEAGSGLDEGGFGNPTTINTELHSGERSYVIDLANRFSKEVPDTVNFAFNSAVLDEEARAILRKQADWIRKFPEVRFRVYGHTDLVGSNAYNKRLGLRRAQAVVAYLATQGISRSRLEAMVSYGETQPIIQTPNEERRNRRTVTEVSGFVANDPLVLDGKYAQIVYREYVASATSPTSLGGSEISSGE